MTEEKKREIKNNSLTLYSYHTNPIKTLTYIKNKPFFRYNKKANKKGFYQWQVM